MARKLRGSVFVQSIIYLVLGCSAILAVIFITMHIVKLSKQRKAAKAKFQPIDYDEDDFICFHKTDGSTITISKGFVVEVKKRK